MPHLDPNRLQFVLAAWKRAFTGTAQGAPLTDRAATALAALPDEAVRELRDAAWTFADLANQRLGLTATQAVEEILGELRNDLERDIAAVEKAPLDYRVSTIRRLRGKRPWWRS